MTIALALALTAFVAAGIGFVAGVWLTRRVNEGEAFDADVFGQN